MIEQTIQQIEARLRASASLTPETRDELLALLATLRAEAGQLPSAPARATSAAAADTEDAGSMQTSIDQLRRSVEEFEDSHPRLVQLTNHVANTLAGLGI
jgi:hypothetical protein